MAKAAGIDPLRQDLCELAALVEPSEVRLFIAGGYGLILKAEYLRENEVRTVAPTPFPRATTDLDLVLSADVVAEISKMAAIRDALETMGYQPVPGRENYQWSRVVGSGSNEVTVKFDLLGQIPADTTGLSLRPRRMRPHGFTGLHAHPAEEAEFIHEGSLAVEVCGGGKPDRIEIPHPFNYLLLKLYAFDDRKEDEDVDYGRHHAFDLYRIVAMLTEEEWNEVPNFRRRHSGSGVVQRATAIVEGSFADEEQLGALRIREHARRAGVDTRLYPVPEFLSDLGELLLG